jgi:hypothetical protein
MVEKNIPVHELKYYHGDDKGFVFIGNARSSDDAIHHLAQFLLSIGVSDQLPAFYTRINSNVTAFVYDKDTDFKSGAFYQAAKRVELMGVYKIEALGYYLEHLKN